MKFLCAFAAPVARGPVPGGLKSADCGTFVPEVPGISRAWQHLKPAVVVAASTRRDSGVIYL
jgi:hypothetical protein